MPFPRPTLTDLRNQAAADITSNVPGADGLLRRSNLGVLGAVLAGLANLHYGYLDWIAKQAVPYTATDEFLQAWGALVGITLKGAAAASGTVTFTGVNGTAIPAGTAIARSDGEAYVTTGAATISSGTVTVSVVGQNPGSAGNCSSGTAMTLVSPIAGVNSNGTAAGDFTGGVDVEEEEDYRVRVLDRYQEPPQGGARSDYINWALDVPGVTRAWVNPNGFGNGTVVVYVMLDQAEAAFSGFPQGSNGVAAAETRDAAAAGDQLIVANAIYPLRPVTALVYVCSPIAAPQNFTIAGLNPNTTATKNAISAAIADVFLREGAPGGTVRMADINAAIDAIPGIVDFVITAPAADIVTTTGYLPTVGTITYV